MELALFKQTRLPIVEIFNSISGEGLSAGSVMTFIRVAGCNLRCSYCDTTYSYPENNPQQLLLRPDEVMDRLNTYPSRNILCTGGEPLEPFKPKRYLPLYVASQGFAVRIETNGSCPVYTAEELRAFANNASPLQINYSLDVKCPDSGMSSHNIYQENFEKLRRGDEIKFVVSSQKDLDFAFQIIREHTPVLAANDVVLDFSPVFGKIHPSVLVDDLKTHEAYYVQNNLQARLSLQIHKVIWDPQERGV